ncbi:MAG: glucosamine-1-phosphate N-acetyltransferase [Clostridia bacterium]|nr:glucosamine-1-phosphate N-acetyltransferase [Clostridia bacterium]
MDRFYALTRVGAHAEHFQREILSCTVFRHMALAVEAAGGAAYLESDVCEGERITLEAFRSLADGAQVLLLLAPAAALSAETLIRLADRPETSALVAGPNVLALWGGADAVFALDPGALPDSVARVQALPIESIPVTDPESAYAVQEQLRRRINLGWMQKGVFLVDPNTTHISPLAVLEPGCTLLPGCLIYGESTVAAGAVVGPNTLLKNARVGENCTVNSSQITDSTVGSGTTVGPFAYIRPGCVIGSGARIGDFVELKNSSVGDGTKISHLTYIGDSDLGRRINVGCGVVTVNYDGKRKYRTTVEDDSFVGCNVNLVSPVKIGRGSYLAAGGTITEDVPEEAFVIARSRATVKRDWVKKRKEAGKL